MQQRRPGFPARISLPTPGQRPVSGTTTRSGSLPGVPVPAGLGLDSAAVRTRMVQRLSAMGVTAPQVLQAMGAVERHRFVERVSYVTSVGHGDGVLARLLVDHQAHARLAVDTQELAAVLG